VPTLRLPAKLESIHHFQDFVRQKIRAWGFHNVAARIELALEEILVNVVHYAYDQEEGDIELTFNLRDPDRLEVEVVDWGKPFNPLTRQSLDPSQDLKSRPIGGWGIAFVRHLADNLDYTREDNKNILLITFFIKP
jgi:anti-sigma regulatory factor (Ser/Thr protein kinase)